MSEIVVVPVSQGSTPSSQVVKETVVVPAAQAPAAPQQEPKASHEAEPAKAEPEEPKLGPKFAHLAKRERELLQKEMSLKELESKVSPLANAVDEARASKNPAKVLEAAGFSLDDVIEFYAQGGEEALSQEPEKSVDELIEEKLAEKERLRQDEENKSKFEARIQQFKEEIAEAAKADQFELVHTLQQHDLVYDVILEHHASSGEVLPISDALAQVEDYLTQQAQRVTSTKKFSMVPQGHQASPQRQEPKTTFTLSSSQASPSVSAPSERLTKEQARERAIAALRFK